MVVRTVVGGSGTSLCYLGKGQACRPLQVNVVGVDERAERAEGFAREEVGLGSLEAGQYAVGGGDGGGGGGSGGRGHTFSRKPSRSATASLSLSASTGSYMLSLERAVDEGR